MAAHTVADELLDIAGHSGTVDLVAASVADSDDAIPKDLAAHSEDLNVGCC